MKVRWETVGLVILVPGIFLMPLSEGWPRWLRVILTAEQTLGMLWVIVHIHIEKRKEWQRRSR